MFTPCIPQSTSILYVFYYPIVDIAFKPTNMDLLSGELRPWALKLIFKEGLLLFIIWFFILLSSLLLVLLLVILGKFVDWLC